MSNVRPIFLIAGNTITGILRGVVLNVLMALALVMILAAMSPSAAGDSPIQIRKTLVDSALAGITVLGAMIAILTGFTMIPGEIESRTIYPVLAKPVRRWQFLLGKYLGAVGINAIVVGLLSIIFFVYYYYMQHSFDGRLPIACFMIFSMLVILSAIIIFLSTFMSWIGTIIVSMIIWLTASYSQFFYDLAANDHAAKNEISKYAFQFVQKILPNFQSMDMRDIIVNNITSASAGSIEPMQWLFPLGVNCIYGIVALAMAILIFNYREV